MSETNLGDFLRELRLNSGFKSQRKLGDMSGVSPATISRIESNTQHPLPETLFKLSPYYKGITYPELMSACGYLEPNDSPEELKLYHPEELNMLNELRKYPELHSDFVKNPSQLKQLESLWKVFKEITEE